MEPIAKWYWISEHWRELAEERELIIIKQGKETVRLRKRVTKLKKELDKLRRWGGW